MSKTKNIIVHKLIAVVLSIFCFLCLQGRKAYADVYMTISGNVQDASTNKGIPNVNVVAIPKIAGQSFQAITDAFGKYVLNSVTEGQYDVYISPPPLGYVYKPYEQEVTVGLGQKIVNLNFQLPPAGAISGTAYLGDGVTPLANTEIFSQTDAGVVVSTTDQTGKYVLNGFPPEKPADIRIFPIGYGMAVINGIDINAGQTTPNIKIMLPNLSSGIQGAVVTSDLISQPIPNAAVSLKGQNGGGMTITDSQGNYKITGLPSGLYEMNVYDMGYAIQTTQVLINQNQFTTANFYLMSLSQSATQSPYASMNNALLTNTAKVPIGFNGGGTNLLANNPIRYTATSGSGASIICANKLSKCALKADINELQCLNAVGKGVVFAATACMGICTFSGPDYLACLGVCEISIAAAGAAAIAFCHGTELGEVAICYYHYWQCMNNNNGTCK